MEAPNRLEYAEGLGRKCGSPGEVVFQEIEFISCFVDNWVGTGDIEVVKGCAKIRLERKITLNWARK